MSDPTTRAAARWATAIALPLTALVGLGAYLALRPAADRPTVRPTHTAGPVPSTAVSMSAATLPVNTRAACRELLRQAPRQLRDLVRRTVTAGPDQNLAYGEPPITMSCGVAPAVVAPTDTVYPLDGICWHRATGAGATVWTTVDRTVPVRVSVPTAYGQGAPDNQLLGAWMGDAQWVIDFSAPVVGAIPAAPTIPFGCRPTS